MKVLIVGHLGNMGRRYAAICDYLGVEWVGKDRDDMYPGRTWDFSHIIVATPTDTHIDELGDLATTFHGGDGVSILCEKPIVHTDTIDHDDYDLYRCLHHVDGLGHKLFMVNNYAHIHQVRQDALRGWRTQDTHYSFYNTGGDGVYWDCIQLIHLAKREIRIDNTAPVWDCKINGVVINRAQVDRAYIDMIKDFIGPQNNLWGYDDIIDAHKKVEAFAKTNSLYCENVPLLAGEASRSESADPQVRESDPPEQTEPLRP
jgi:hypothetical protein